MAGDDFLIKTMIPVREDSEVVIIHPDTCVKAPTTQSKPARPTMTDVTRRLSSNTLGRSSTEPKKCFNGFSSQGFSPSYFTMIQHNPGNNLKNQHFNMVTTMWGLLDS